MRWAGPEQVPGNKLALELRALRISLVQILPGRPLSRCIEISGTCFKATSDFPLRSDLIEKKVGDHLKHDLFLRVIPKD